MADVPPPLTAMPLDPPTCPQPPPPDLSPRTEVPSTRVPSPRPRTAPGQWRQGRKAACGGGAPGLVGHIHPLSIRIS